MDRVRLRPRLNFIPDFSTVEPWTIKAAFHNEWRTQPDHDADDLVQEGRILFHKIECRYWPEVQTPKHFATLYRVSYLNKINNLAKARTHRLKHIMEGADELVVGKVASGFSEVDLEDLLKTLEPDHVLHRLIVQLVEGELRQRPQRLGPYQYGKRRPRETTNQFFCRVAGAKPGTDVVSLLHWLLFGEAHHV